MDSVCRPDRTRAAASVAPSCCRLASAAKTGDEPGQVANDSPAERQDEPVTREGVALCRGEDPLGVRGAAGVRDARDDLAVAQHQLDAAGDDRV